MQILRLIFTNRFAAGAAIEGLLSVLAPRTGFVATEPLVVLPRVGAEAFVASGLVAPAAPNFDCDAAVGFERLEGMEDAFVTSSSRLRLSPVFEGSTARLGSMFS